MKRSHIPIILTSFLILSCDTPQITSEEVPPCHKIAAVSSAKMDWKPGEMSLYNLTSSWINQNNDSVLLEGLQGKLQLVALMYTSCGYACPRIIHDLKSIDEKLSQEEKKIVHIALVTLDPERDTPENLKSFANKYQLDTERWTLLTGNESDTRELSGLLNVKWRREMNQDISHSNIISLLNADGELIHQKEGLGLDPDEMIKEIKKIIHKSI